MKDAESRFQSAKGSLDDGTSAGDVSIEIGSDLSMLDEARAVVRLDQVLVKLESTVGADNVWADNS